MAAASTFATPFPAPEAQPRDVLLRWRVDAQILGIFSLQRRFPEV